MNRFILILLIALIIPYVGSSQSASNTVAGREEFEKGHNLFVLEEFKQAEEWFKKAVDRGHILSMTYLGSLYQNAMNKPGFTRDYNEALKWYKMAAEKGEYTAMRSLSNMYSYGYGVPADAEESKRWRDKANTAKTAEDARLAKAKAASELKLQAARNIAASSTNGGQLLDQGVTAYNSKKFAEALTLFTASAGMGQAGAMFNIGVMYAQGEGVAVDKSEALKWYKKSAEDGLSQAMGNIGAMYYRGEGIARDVKQAFDWFQKAAAAGLTDGMYNLAIMFEKGEGTNQDTQLAKTWYKKAADKGHENAATAYKRLNIIPVAKAPLSQQKPVVNTLVPYLGKNGKYGLADRSGKVVITPKFDFVPKTKDDLIYVRENKKYGVLDGRGRILLEAKYNMFSDFYEGLARVKIDDQTSGSIGYHEAFIDKSGKVIIQGGPGKVLNGDFSDGRAVIIGSSGIGFIDRTGKVVIAPKYKTNMFSNYGNIFTLGTARVERPDGTVTLINTSGQELTTKPYQDIKGNTSFIQFHVWEGVFVYKLNDKYGFLDKSGRELTPPVYSSAEPFSDGLGRFGINNQYGFVDRTGKVAIPASYIVARDFKNGLASVKVGNKWGFIDKTGKLVIPADFDDAGDFSEDVASVKYHNKYFYINKQGQIVIDPGAVEYAGPFREGMAPVRKNELYGFIDKTGAMRVQTKYVNIGFNAFDDGIMILEATWGKWLAIDRSGKEFKE